MRWQAHVRHLAVAALLAVAVPASAQKDGGEAPADDTGPPPVVAVEREGPIELDGVLSEPAWERARAVTRFVQGEPVEGGVPGERTSVRVVYDDDALYVGARLEESAARVVEQLIRRDQTGQSDYFQVSFDTNRDRRTGYLFRVNAAGVQRDAYLYNDTRTDDSWDAVWQSRVTRDEGGWTVELRIPWSQLRYERSPADQTWGVNFERWRVAAGERTYHALIPRNQHGQVRFFRSMEGVRPPSDVRRIELRPYVLARGRAAPEEPDNPFFNGLEAGAQTGVDMRYGLGTSFTLDATINPDFGQVEVDPAVINLSAFETRFSERRPFFVEDARVLDFSVAGRGNELFYSRRIGRSPQGGAPDGAAHVDVPDQTTILGAAKLTGRTVGGLSLGALAAVTAAEEARAYYPSDAPAGDSIVGYLAEPRSQYAVVRARQDLRGGATALGGVVTAVRRELPADGSFDFLPSGAYTGGIDWEHMWADRTWAFTGFVAGSLVRGDSIALTRIQRSSNHYFQRPDSRLSVDSSSTSLAGASWELGLERRGGGENWTGRASLARTTPGFEINDMGYSRMREQVDLNLGVTYREIEPGPLLRDYRINLSTFQNWRGSALDRPLDGSAWGHAHKGGSVWLDGRWTLNNFWGGSAQVAYRPRGLDDGATRGGPLMVSPATRKVEGRLNTDRRRAVSLAADAEYQWGEALTELDVGLELTWRPGPRLEVELGPTYSVGRVADQYVAAFDAPSYGPTYGRRYLFGEMDRRSLALETRLDVTFTRNLTLQLFAQPLLDAGRFSAYRQLARAATFEFIELEPGTAIGDPAAPPSGCEGGSICERDGVQYIDFSGDGSIDASFRDRDFNVVSLTGNAVLRWEYRPGSTIFVVWQQRRFERRPFGDFDPRRDPADLFGAAPENVLMLKVNYWISP